MSEAVHALEKVLVIGEGGTGKTCLIRRYVQSMYQSNLKATVGADFALKVIKKGNVNLNLQIWDIAGQERYEYMTRTYYERAVAAMVACDVTRPETMELATKWKEDMALKMLAGPCPPEKPIPCILIITKCDLGQLHKGPEEMDAFCKEHGFMGWFETSAKENKNVTEAFNALVELVVSYRSAMGHEVQREPVVKLNQPARKEKCQPKREL